MMYNLFEIKIMIDYILFLSFLIIKHCKNYCFVRVINENSKKTVFEGILIQNIPWIQAIKPYNQQIFMYPTSGL